MTTAPIRLGIVGLGAMGRHLLADALGHPDFTVTHAVDLAPETIAVLEAEHLGVNFSTSIADVIGAGDVDAVYLATPPATHAALAVPAFEAGQAVFCEKPLAVSDTDAAAMLAAAGKAGQAAGVNFVLSDRLSARYVEQAIAGGQVGEVLGVEIRLAFPVWPRGFQAEATWVGERAQGGFVREVFSHFAYLTDRLVGPLRAVHTELEHRSEASETAAYGLLKAGKVPVQLSGIVGAAGPETYEWILRGTKQSYKLTAWRDLFVAEGNTWRPVELTGAPGSETTRLTLFAQAIRGDHSPDLAGFAAAERVRQAVEAFHRVKVIEAVDRDTLRLVERASIPLQAGEVRIAVVAAGVNYLDIQERTGAYPREFPYVPGGEGSGVVIEVAPDVSAPAVGQRVCWQGVQASYAEEVVAPARKVIPLPADVSHQHAAAVLLQGLTAQYLTTDSYAVQPGDLIVVHAGAGGVGLLLTQLAKSLGAKVITTVSTRQKAALSQAAGADQAVTYEDLRSAVAGRAAAVYDSVGRTTFEDSLHALAPRGTVVLYGQSSGPVPPFDLSRLGPAGSLTITRPTLRHFVSTPASLHSQAALLFDHLRTGTLTPPITTTYPLADAAEAHEALQSRSTTGKLLLLPAATTHTAPDRAPRPAPE